MTADKLVKGLNSAMAIEGLTPSSFDLQGTLTQSGARGRARVAPLGLLLNRIKRMPEDKRAKVQIDYGSIAFRSADIEELLLSDEYAAWLRAPIVPLRW